MTGQCLCGAFEGNYNANKALCGMFQIVIIIDLTCSNKVHADCIVEPGLFIMLCCYQSDQGVKSQIVYHVITSSCKNKISCSRARLIMSADNLCGHNIFIAKDL